MALWTCAGCGAAYSVGAPCCPHCGSGDYLEDDVPKISSTGEATGAMPAPPASDPEPVAGTAIDARAGGPEASESPVAAGPAAADGTPDASQDAPDAGGDGAAVALEASVPGAETSPDGPETAEAGTPSAPPKPAKAPKAPPKAPPAKAPDG